jgi:hypothetical protein
VESLTSPGVRAAARSNLRRRSGSGPIDVVAANSVADARPNRIGPVRWGPLDGVAAPWQQLGTWGAPTTTQTPSVFPGAQRGCVAGTIYPGWQVAANQQRPDIWRAMYPGHHPGAQRRSRNYGTGPTSVINQAVASRVTGAAAAANSRTIQAQLRAYGGR